MTPDRAGRFSLCLYAQLLAGVTMLGCRFGGQTLWLSALLTVPFLLLVHALNRRAQGPAPRLLAAAALLDALAAYVPLCRLCQFLLTDLPPAAVAALITGFSLLCGTAEDRAVTVLARPTALLTALPLLFAALLALPQGSVGRLFPLLGKGLPAIGADGLWLLGCLSPACLCKATATPRADGLAGKTPLRPLIAAALSAAATAALFSWLLPDSAQTAASAWVDRLTLPARFSLPAAAWPLLMAALILLFFYAHLSALHAACLILLPGDRRAARRRFLYAALALLLLPMGALKDAAAERALFAALPLRAVPALAALILWRVKKTPPEKEAPHA